MLPGTPMSEGQEPAGQLEPSSRIYLIVTTTGRARFLLLALCSPLRKKNQGSLLKSHKEAQVAGFNRDRRMRFLGPFFMLIGWV